MHEHMRQMNDDAKHTKRTQCKFFSTCFNTTCWHTTLTVAARFFLFTTISCISFRFAFFVFFKRSIYIYICPNSRVGGSVAAATTFDGLLSLERKRLNVCEMQSKNASFPMNSLDLANNYAHIHTHTTPHSC